jgi:hypothetical protein
MAPTAGAAIQKSIAGTFDFSNYVSILTSLLLIVVPLSW